MRGRAMTAALAILVLPAFARSQEPVKSFDQLNTRLKVGDRIFVTDTRGREHEGKVLELSGSALVLKGDGAQKLAAADVELVQERQRDSLTNGALIGMGTALALVGGAVIVSTGSEEHYGYDPALVTAAVAFYAGIGAAIGTGIDALIPGQKRIVYRAPGGRPATAVQLRPVITPRSKGLALSLSF